jgi:hypothetical protein
MFEKQPDDDLIWPKHVAVWMQYTVVFDGYFFIVYFASLRIFNNRALPPTAITLQASFYVTSDEEH